jgi:hypothetical protein
MTAMHVNPHPASVRPYLPSLYLPGSRGRYRKYPKMTTTRIPGAGYRVGRGVWGEQVLYLGGYGDLFSPGNGTYPYGRYAAVPLRGLGQVAPGGWTSWLARPWVWAAAGVAALVLGVGSYMALGRLRRNRRRMRRNAAAKHKIQKSAVAWYYPCPACGAPDLGKGGHGKGCKLAAQYKSFSVPKRRRRRAR